MLGYPDQALRRSEEALRLAQELRHPFSMAMALSFAAQVNWLSGELDLAEERTKALTELSSEHGFGFWAAQAAHMQGHVLASRGQREEGLEQLRKSHAALEASGMELGKWGDLAMQAQAYGKLGERDKAMILLAEAEAEAEKQQMSEHYSELYRFKGETLQTLSKDNHAEAEKCFRKALEVANRQGAKSYELKTAMSLSRFLKDHGKKEEARAILAEVYNSFTEGFDTSDLKKASALLQELS